jgi:hypothetical protein
MDVHRRNQAFVRSVAPGEVGAHPQSNLLASQNIDTITTLRQALAKTNFSLKSSKYPISLQYMAQRR